MQVVMMVLFRETENRPFVACSASSSLTRLSPCRRNDILRRSLEDSSVTSV